MGSGNQVESQTKPLSPVSLPIASLLSHTFFPSDMPRSLRIVLCCERDKNCLIIQIVLWKREKYLFLGA